MSRPLYVSSDANKVKRARKRGYDVDYELSGVYPYHGEGWEAFRQVLKEASTSGIRVHNEYHTLVTFHFRDASWMGVCAWAKPAAEFDLEVQFGAFLRKRIPKITPI